MTRPNDQVSLKAALAKCVGGETIELGDFRTPISLVGFGVPGSPFRAAIPNDRPITLAGGTFKPTMVRNPDNDADPHPYILMSGRKPLPFLPYSIMVSLGQGLRNIVVDGLKIEGQPYVPVIDPSWGYPTGYIGYLGVGVSLRGTKNVGLKNLDLKWVNRGIGVAYSDDILVEDIDVNVLQHDAFNFEGVRRMSVRRLYAAGFFGICGPNGAGDHNDVIQCWSNNTVTGQVFNPDQELVRYDNQDILLEDICGVGELGPNRENLPGRRPQFLFLSDSRHGGHTGVMIIRPRAIDPAWHGIAAAHCIEPYIEDALILSRKDNTLNPIRSWIFTRHHDPLARRSSGLIIRSKAPGFTTDAMAAYENKAPEGCEKLDWQTDEQATAAHQAWLDSFRPGRKVPTTFDRGAPMTLPPIAPPPPPPTPTPTPRQMLESERDTLTIQRSTINKRLIKVRAELKKMEKAHG